MSKMLKGLQPQQAFHRSESDCILTPSQYTASKHNNAPGQKKTPAP
jgi:hypothetical protein